MRRRSVRPAENDLTWDYSAGKEQSGSGGKRMYALLRVPSALQALDAKLEISADLRVARLFLWPARARDDPSMRVRLWEITSDARAVRRGREVDGVRAGGRGAARLPVPLGRARGDRFARHRHVGDQGAVSRSSSSTRGRRSGRTPNRSASLARRGSRSTTSTTRPASDPG